MSEAAVGYRGGGEVVHISWDDDRVHPRTGRMVGGLRGVVGVAGWSQTGVQSRAPEHERRGEAAPSMGKLAVTSVLDIVEKGRVNRCISWITATPWVSELARLVRVLDIWRSFDPDQGEDDVIHSHQSQTLVPQSEPLVNFAFPLRTCSPFDRLVHTSFRFARLQRPPDVAIVSL